MKRALFVVVSIWLCLVYLISCKGTQNDKNPTLTVTSDVYRNESAFGSDVKISYPQLEGEKYTGINELIKDYAIEQVNLFYDGDFSNLTVDISHRVTLCDDEMLSVIFEGVGNVQTAAYPNLLFYTLNIDLKTGEKLALRDIYNIDGAFVSAYKTSPYVQCDESLAEVMTEYMSGYTDNELTDMLFAADTELSGVYSYFTSEKVGISITTIHALGDHMEVEISYDSVKDNKHNSISEDLK